jgi:putative acetyltransferase
VQSVAIEPARQPDVEKLLRVGEQFALSLYPPESCYLLDVGELEHPDVTVFVARVDGEARGMAALVDKRDGSAELKRLFIDDAARRLGLARQLLERIEEFGGAAGAHLIQLETGPRSFAAIALYESSGYRRIPNFGQYVDDPHSVCMEKELA